MSAGPIKQARDAWKPTLVSTPDSGRVCAPNIDTGRAVCGRKNPTRTDEWSRVTCADCHAAARADRAGEAR
jgi:hypothetical protein